MRSAPAVDAGGLLALWRAAAALRAEARCGLHLDVMPTAAAADVSGRLRQLADVLEGAARGDGSALADAVRSLGAGADADTRDVLALLAAELTPRGMADAA